MKKFALVPLIMLALLLMFNLGCEPEEPDDPDALFPPPNIAFGEMTDARDGQKYKTIEIGTQTWMAENLNYITGNSWCYGDNPKNCEIYGRLYDWITAASIACPSGWRLPSDADWTVLTDHLGGLQVAGGKMKSTTLWRSPNTGASNESGWSGLPGGHRYIGGGFNDLGIYGIWWSYSVSDTGIVFSRGLFCNNSRVYRFSGNYLDSCFSVRCLRD